ncbi:Hypothetical predicted protein [Pelobates cultripes]|uniref:Uncharacterized protein n=1 Tax=Pelobates cultripes TaxID=61616 RepID=A0AAD1RMW5_PELCU|nr:Hypothetical predicted protein [Pelobates cultripes]
MWKPSIGYPRFPPSSPWDPGPGHTALPTPGQERDSHPQACCGGSTVVVEVGHDPCSAQSLGRMSSALGPLGGRVRSSERRWCSRGAQRGRARRAFGALRPTWRWLNGGQHVRDAGIIPSLFFHRRLPLPFICELLKDMKPSSLKLYLEQRLEAADAEQEITQRELDWESCYLCHTLLKLANIVVAAKKISLNKCIYLQKLCIQLNKHIINNIRENPVIMYRSKLKDLATYNYIRWQDMLFEDPRKSLRFDSQALRGFCSRSPGQLFTVWVFVPLYLKFSVLAGFTPMSTVRAFVLGVVASLHLNS